jgi:hypothetical protein
MIVHQPSRHRRSESAGVLVASRPGPRTATAALTRPAPSPLLALADAVLVRAGPLVTTHGWRAVRPRWRAYLATADGRFVSPHRFAETFSEWAEVSATTRPGSKPSVGEAAMAMAARFIARGKP